MERLMLTRVLSPDDSKNSAEGLKIQQRGASFYRFLNLLA
jgi:hypothetical protein